MTYAESKNKPTFDWAAALDNAIMRGATRDERDNMIRLARNWVTCAVGNQCDLIPRVKSGHFPGHPVDVELQNLGLVFCSHIEYGDFYEARDTLLAIESRSAALIADIQQQK